MAKHGNIEATARPLKRRLAFDDAAPEIKPTLMAMAKLEHRASQARKESR